MTLGLGLLKKVIWMLDDLSYSGTWGSQNLTAAGWIMLHPTVCSCRRHDTLMYIAVGLNLQMFSTYLPFHSSFDQGNQI